MHEEINRINSGRDRARGLVKAARALLRGKDRDLEAADYLLAHALKDLQPIKRTRRTDPVEVADKVARPKKARKSAKSARSEAAKRAWKTRRRKARRAA